MAGRGGRKRLHAKLSATLVECGHHVLVAVRVDSRRSARGRCCHGGHRHPFRELITGGWPHVPGRRTGQGRALETGSYEVTFARPVWTGRCGGLGRQITAQAAQAPAIIRVRPSPRTSPASHSPVTRRPDAAADSSSLPLFERRSQPRIQITADRVLWLHRSRSQPQARNDGPNWSVSTRWSKARCWWNAHAVSASSGVRTARYLGVDSTCSASDCPQSCRAAACSASSISRSIRR